MKGDGACTLVSGCQFHVLEWRDSTIEIGEEDAFRLRFQRLRERHLLSLTLSPNFHNDGVLNRLLRY